VRSPSLVPTEFGTTPRSARNRAMLVSHIQQSVSGWSERADVFAWRRPGLVGRIRTAAGSNAGSDAIDLQSATHASGTGPHSGNLHTRRSRWVWLPVVQDRRYRFASE